MAIGIGVSSKGRNGSTSSLATTGVATQATGSIILACAIWNSTETFSSIADNKGNSANYVQIGAELTLTGAKARLYYCKNAAGGAGHTVTFTVSALSNILVLMTEITGADTAAPLDQSNGRNDTSSPFTLAAGLTTTQANEALVSPLFGSSGSNPATHAETGLGSSTIQTGAEETNGASFWTGAIATALKSATGTFNPSWTETGGSNSILWLATYKEAAAAGGTWGPLLAQRNNRLVVAA